MKQYWLVCIAAICLSLQWTSTVKAEEPYQKFLEALRSNGYHEYALSYLDQIAKKPGVPAKIRDSIDYERANTLIKQAAVLTNPDTKKAKLVLAEKFLQKFLKEHTRHTLVGKAQMEQGKIFLSRARAINYRLDAESVKKNVVEQNKLTKQSRSLIAKAKVIFEKARSLAQAKEKSFPPYIPPEQKEKIIARDEAIIALLSAQIQAGLCLYEEAQTYKGQQFKRRLMTAAKAFEKIHNENRKKIGGLYAHMLEGKCYEEQGASLDIRRALGIYNALMQHPGDTPIMVELKSKVLKNKLICLNHTTKKDYQLVIESADKWLLKNRNVTPISIGIRWQRAVAAEMLGKQKDLTANERKQFTRSARNDAELLSRYDGEYQELSLAMLKRVRMALGQKDVKPKDFESAIGRAESLFGKIYEMEPQIDKETNKDKKSVLQNEFNEHLKKTADMFRLGLSLANYKSTPKQLHQARAMLSYTLYLMKEDYQAAVYAGYVAENARRIDNDIALQAASLDAAIWVRAYYAVPRGKPTTFEENRLIKASERIVTYWPQKEQAANALMNLGRLYSGQNKPAKAAAQYNRIPSSSPNYAEAQMKAGQAYWTVYLKSNQLPQADQPDKKTMTAWQSAAEKHLITGVTAIAKKVAKNKTTPPELSSGKLSLAQIYVNTGKYAQAISLLTKEPHSVSRAIVVKNEKDRPEFGVKSKSFAIAVHSLLLKGYIQSEQIDKAIVSLKQLEKIGGKTDLGTYRRLGDELKADIKRHQKQGQTVQLQKVLSSLDKFLTALSQKKEGQTYGSLIWVAETYNGLGAAMLQDDTPAAKGYFKKAAASYNKIIDRAATEGEKFVDNDRLLRIKIRLVNCKREEGKFQEGFTMAEGLLKKKPSNMNLQHATAQLLQDWGKRDHAVKYLEAIHGNLNDKPPGRIWGWGYIAHMLQAHLNNMAPDSPRAKEFEAKWVEAHYESALCRYEYAQTLKVPAKNKKQLTSASTEILGFVSIAGDLENDDWDKFASLYKKVQLAQGVSKIVPLEKPKTYQPASQPPPKKTIQNAGTKKKKKPTTSKKIPETNWLWAGIALAITLVAAGGMVFIMTKSSKNTNARPTYNNDAPDMASIDAARKRTAKKRELQREKSRKKGTSPSRKRSASATGTKRRSTEASPKPRRRKRETE